MIDSDRSIIDDDRFISMFEQPISNDDRSSMVIERSVIENERALSAIERSIIDLGRDAGSMGWSTGMPCPAGSRCSPVAFCSIDCKGFNGCISPELAASDNALLAALDALG
jgi:hypothetical protein